MRKWIDTLILGFLFVAFVGLMATYVSTQVIGWCVAALVAFTLGLAYCLVAVLRNAFKAKQQIDEMIQRLEITNQVHVKFHPDDEELASGLLEGVISSRLEDDSHSIDTKQLLRVILRNRYLKKDVL